MNSLAAPLKVDISDIQKAHGLLKPIVKYTDLDLSLSASQMFGRNIYLKFENTQRTGSFKIRGAYNKIMNLSPDEKGRGVVASSAGNHAQGVALSSKLAGVKAKIVMPETAPLNKIIATRHYGGEVILKGEIYDDAYEYAKELEKKEGYTFVHPYQDSHVIAGQGTIGLEILSQLPDVDSVIVPIGGGGLISGISLAIKTLKPSCKIFGVQSDQTPGMSQLYRNQPSEPRSKRITTIADGIAIKKPSQEMCDYFISKYVDDIVTVTDDDIAEAIVYLVERMKTVTEGSGAVSFAGLMKHQLEFGKNTCVLLSGGNIDLNIISKVIERGQIKRGRIAKMSVVVEDMPGNLQRLTQIIAVEKANILEVNHDRVTHGLSLRETRIDFFLETNSFEQIQKIESEIEKVGGKILRIT
ncbi:MAG: threonine ammonia-lyase [Bdellovibrionaceae bacterium]|nr:threonine ammonia-lyase [Pseudobdellovibrionaceae bacterium]